MTTIICDIDGVLCENKRVSYASKWPDHNNIQRLKVLSAKGYRIILHTSRSSRYRKQTLSWLRLFEIPFNKLVMCKPKGDYYVDDKAVKLKQIK